MTSAVANIATGMTDSAGSKTCGEKMGREESSKISDRADCPDAKYEDRADHTEPSNNLLEARRPPHPRQHRGDQPGTGRTNSAKPSSGARASRGAQARAIGEQQAQLLQQR